MEKWNRMGCLNWGSKLDANAAKYSSMHNLIGGISGGRCDTVLLESTIHPLGCAVRAFGQPSVFVRPALGVKEIRPKFRAAMDWL